MTQMCNPAAVRFGPFLFEPINGRLLGARVWKDASVADSSRSEAMRVLRQAPVAPRPLPVVR